MTATPHRGKEWLFRHLLHLVDPDVYPDPGRRPEQSRSRPLRPGPIHFLRRMKEDLVDYDGKTRLFKGRTAPQLQRRRCRQSSTPTTRPPSTWSTSSSRRTPQPLARMVYGKRAASSLYALAETLSVGADSHGRD